METGWDLAMYALGFVFLITTFLSAFSISKSIDSHPLENYLLASRDLSRPSIISLLISSSFGLNALFYAVWLGYTIGGWALLIQAAWSASFFFLAPYTNSIRKHKSLHDLLGDRFGVGTRVIAGLCSLIGIMYFIGWEVGVGKATISGLVSSRGEINSDEANLGASWIVGGLVFGCLLYTVLGGLRGNAKADLVLNCLKVTGVIVLTYLLIQHFYSISESSFWKVLFPSYETMVANLGLWGLATNVVFNLAWQFVDTSSWQSIIAGAKSSEEEVAKTIRLSGVSIFVIPGVIATLFGASLIGTTGISPENILVVAVSLVPGFNGVMLFAVFVGVAACIMSLIDGYFLAAAYTLIVDIIHPTEKLDDLDSNTEKAERLLLTVRIGLVVVAIIAIVGVAFLLERLGLNLFDFVYIVIVTQLALIGPVLVALATTRVAIRPLWLPILIALVMGFSCILLGTWFDIKWIVDGAGTFTVITSCILALIVTRRI